ASLGFFRDPDRDVPSVPGGVLSPADGRVLSVDELDDPFVGPAVRVAIFLSPLDVHVNRSPIAGLVVGTVYSRGRFIAAYRAAAEGANERCSLHLQGETARVTVVQIAGVLARRIVCRVGPGDKLAAGERGSSCSRACSRRGTSSADSGRCSSPSKAGTPRPRWRSSSRWSWTSLTGASRA